MVCRLIEMAPKKRRGDSASSSQPSTQDVPPPLPREPPRVAVDTTPSSFGFRLQKPEHRERFNYLKTRDWVSTRFLDFELIEAMGIQDDLDWMAE